MNTHTHTHTHTERERERERQTHTHTHTHTHRQARPKPSMPSPGFHHHRAYSNTSQGTLPFQHGTFLYSLLTNRQAQGCIPLTYTEERACTQKQTAGRLYISVYLILLKKLLRITKKIYTLSVINRQTSRHKRANTHTHTHRHLHKRPALSVQS